MFGAGTACVVCPIKRILYVDQPLYIPTPSDSLALRLYKELGAIQVRLGTLGRPGRGPIAEQAKPVLLYP